ncbi:MAG TPA: helix-hairpin-helix domain-containing protein [Bryobacteraceae bacterium]|nr:helix-hairpin-helix domain-containing protein [Bryobacteraceae bacterium]
MSAGFRIFSVAVLAAAIAAGQENSNSVLDKFPDADEKELVTSTCSACHTLSRVAANHRDQAQWAQTIKNHESRGLKLDPEDAKPIVRYLAAWFGPLVNINQGTASEFADLPGVSRDMADAAVKYRDQHGPFRSTADLSVIEGFSPVVLAKLRNRLSTGAEKPAETGSKK